jgi:DNA-binding FadR family transcriptional regulator
MGTVEKPEFRDARSRVESIFDTIVSRIERGLIRPGERLPSIRVAARTFGVSKNTTVDAYERLVASGQVESRPGSGF